MARVLKDFDSLDAAVQSFVLDHTWCDECAKADLGLRAPSLYEEEGKLFVAGACAKCGAQVLSEIVETTANG